MAHKFDTVKWEAKKQAKEDIENQATSDIQNVSDLKTRVFLLEKVVGINAKS